MCLVSVGPQGAAVMNVSSKCWPQGPAALMNVSSKCWPQGAALMNVSSKCWPRCSSNECAVSVGLRCSSNECV